MVLTTGLDFFAPLFVPAHRPERFEKAATSGADAIIIDLEDAVPAGAKATARSSLRADFTDLPVLIRVNGMGTPWHSDDLAAAQRLPIAGIVMPKAEMSLECVSSSATRKMPVVALIESARGIADARAIVTLPNVARLAFGSIDFCTDLGCAHTHDALLAARLELVLASRLACKPAPIDGVTTSLDNESLLTDDARYASDLGFGGKLCIHPRQVTPVLNGFRPSESETAWARKVLASGDGAVPVDGAMVDEPVRARARSIMRRSEGVVASTAPAP